MSGWPKGEPKFDRTVRQERATPAWTPKPRRISGELVKLQKTGATKSEQEASFYADLVYRLFKELHPARLSHAFQ